MKIKKRPSLFTTCPEGVYRVRVSRMEYPNMEEARENNWSKVKALVTCEILEGEHAGKRIGCWSTFELDDDGVIIDDSTPIGQLFKLHGIDFTDGEPLDMSIIEGSELYAVVSLSTRSGSTLHKITAWQWDRDQQHFYGWTAIAQELGIGRHSAYGRFKDRVPIVTGPNGKPTAAATADLIKELKRELMEPFHNENSDL